MIDSLGPIWEALGANLQHLELKIPLSAWPMLQFDKLMAFCPNITGLTLYTYSSTAEAVMLAKEIEDVSIFYGKNLRELKLFKDQVGQPA